MTDYSALVGRGTTNFRDIFAPGSSQLAEDAGVFFISSFTGSTPILRWRIWIPPGTRSLQATIYTYASEPESKVLMRMHQPPVGDLNSVTPENAAAVDLTNVLATLFTGVEIPCYAPPVIGSVKLSASMLDSPVVTTTGGWLYVNALQTPGQQIFKIESYISVDKAQYLSWYNSAVWDDAGNPVYDETAPATESIVTPVTPVPPPPVTPSIDYGTSKIYNFIYDMNGDVKLRVNSTLKSPSIAAQIGTLTPPGMPNVSDQLTTLNTILPIGFDSYLTGINFSTDEKVAMGAFSYAMQQIRNITSVSVEKLAHVAQNLETTTGLNQPGTASSPMNASAIQQALYKVALGSGPKGTYTMSNFIGCMSGLPYDWSGIYNDIKSIETKLLYDTYRELFLSVTWAQAFTTAKTAIRYRGTTVTSSGTGTIITSGTPKALIEYVPGIPAVEGVSDEVPCTPAVYVREYTITGFHDGTGPDAGKYFSPGGGYGRMGAPKPTTSVTSPDPFPELSGRHGAPLSNPTGAVIELDIDVKGDSSAEKESDKESPSSFGKVYKLRKADQYSPIWVPFKKVEGSMIFNEAMGKLEPGGPPEPITSSMTVPGVVCYIQSPPIDYPDFTKNFPFGTGKNSDGYVPSRVTAWPKPMDSVTKSYISKADEEISRIKTDTRVINGKSPQSTAVNLNIKWDSTGKQLSIEQRAIDLCHSVDVPLYETATVKRDDTLSKYPITQYSFVDSMPQYAKNILPHMYAQSIEAITDMGQGGNTGTGGASTAPGDSMVAMMRESRNTERLAAAGIFPDNNIESTLTDQEISELLSKQRSSDIPTYPTAGVKFVDESDIYFRGIDATVPPYLVQNKVTAPSGQTPMPTVADNISNVIGISTTGAVTVQTTGFTRYSDASSLVHRITHIAPVSYRHRTKGINTTIMVDKVKPGSTNFVCSNPMGDRIYYGATYNPIINNGDQIVFNSQLYTSTKNVFVGVTYTIFHVADTDFTLIGASANTVGVSFVATGLIVGTGMVKGPCFRGNAVNGTSLIAGKRYAINRAGTLDWTTVGAANSTVGTVFVASGAATGSFSGDDMPLATPLYSDVETDKTYYIRDVVLTSLPGNANPFETARVDREITFNVSLTSDGPPITITYEATAWSTTTPSAIDIGPGWGSLPVMLSDNKIYIDTETALIVPLVVNDKVTFAPGLYGILQNHTYYVKEVFTHTDADLGDDWVRMAITIADSPGGDVVNLGKTTWRENNSQESVEVATMTQTSGMEIFSSTSLSDISLGENVVFSNMKISDATPSTFGNLVDGVPYSVRSKSVDNTSFTVYNSAKNGPFILREVGRGGWTGCDMITSNGADNVDPITVVAVPVTISGVTPRRFTVTDIQGTSRLIQSIDSGSASILCNVTGFTVGDTVVFSGDQVTDIDFDQVYYIVAIGNGSCQISTTIDGDPITITKTTGDVYLNVNVMINCDSTAGFKSGDVVKFREMYVDAISVTAFGNLLDGDSYNVASVYSPTAFTVTYPDGSPVILSPVLPGPTTGCMLLHMPTEEAATTLTTDTFYTVVTGDDLTLYTDETLTTPVTSTDLGIVTDAGTIQVQIGTMYIVVPEPTGVYDPATGDFIYAETNTPAPVGAATEPGSFASNPYQSLIPPVLNVNLGSGILLPSITSSQEAIDELIRCNCDSWPKA